MDRSKIKIRFFDGMHSLNSPIGSSGRALLYCSEIHLDARLKQRPEELKETLKHEYRHFEIFEENKNNLSLFWVKTFLFDLRENRKRQLLFLLLWFLLVGIFLWGKGF